MSLATALPRASGWTETLATIRNGFRVHALLYGVVLATSTFAVAESIWLRMRLDLRMVIIFSGPTLLVLALMVLCGLGLEATHLARTGHSGSALAALGRKIRDDYLAPMRLSNALHTGLVVSTFATAYTFTKKAIPLVHPFAWDETFMRWGKAIHFGMQPYQILAPVLDVPLATYGLSMIYALWFPIMFCCLFWQGFERSDTALRLQFLLGFMLTWFIGSSMLGTLFSAAGPAFYGRLLPGPDPYAPLMAWLVEANRSYPIWSLPVTKELWNAYDSGAQGLNGISAMPSMHVATSVLIAILGFASGPRWLGWMLSAFAVLVFFGSIHLGWHYAVDDYAGAVVAASSWWIAGKLVAWDRRRRGAV